jgi:uncharacterized damage-inducible protein DinB
MSAAIDLLLDGFDRVRQVTHAAVDGLAPEQLGYRVDPDANSIGWLVWHLTRIQDDHIADVAKSEQVWTAEGWADRFGLPFSSDDTGYGHDSSAVAAFGKVSAEQLTGYYDAVHQRTLEFVRLLDDAQLADVVDERWDPPVTLAVRLVSVISDDLQHAGQAMFVRGVVSRQP